MRRAVWFFGIFAIVLAVVYGSALSPWVADDHPQISRTQSGSQVEIVKSPKYPLHRDLLTIREEVTIPQAGGPPESLLAGIVTIVVDDKGWVYISDFKDQRVKVYDPDGRFIRGLGKAGQGPGEYQELDSIFLTSRNVLGLHDAQRQHVHYFSPDGRYLRSLSVPKKVNSGGGRSLSIDGRDNFFSISNVGERALNRLWSEVARMGKSMEMDDILETVEQPTAAGTIFKRIIIRGRPSGGVVVGHTWEYLFRFYDTEGRLEKEVSTDYDPIFLTKEESDYWYKKSNTRPKYFRPVSDFVVDDRGWLIVRTPKRTPDRKAQFFDIFDDQGRFQAQMTLPTRDYLKDSFGWTLIEPFYATNGRVYIVMEDDEGNVFVQRYGIAWSSAAADRQQAHFP